ncbi:hypothetical protein [Limnospira fusiformis]
MSQKVSFFIVALGGDQLEIFTKIYQSAVTHQYLAKKVRYVGNRDG